MKIIIHSLDELLQLTALIRRAEPEAILRVESEAERYVSSGQFAAELAHAELAASYDDQPEGLPTGIEPPASRGQTYGEVVAAVQQLHEAIVGESLDGDGAPYSTDWHSDPAKLTAKGLWRARRGRDEDAYKAWLLEQAVEVAEAAIASDEAETVATETHALPQDELPEGVTRRAEGAEDLEVAEEDAILEGDVEAPVDLEALIAASQEAALDASDSHVDLLNACRDFTSKHGHPAFTALKAAVAPDGDSGQGKTVQHLTPSERRLMQACIANYPNKAA